jgi:hypothetical protein
VLLALALVLVMVLVLVLVRLLLLLLLLLLVTSSLWRDRAIGVLREHHPGWCWCWRSFDPAAVEVAVRQPPATFEAIDAWLMPAR